MVQQYFIAWKYFSETFIATNESNLPVSKNLHQIHPHSKFPQKNRIEIQITKAGLFFLHISSMQKNRLPGYAAVAAAVVATAAGAAAGAAGAGAQIYQEFGGIISDLMHRCLSRR